MNILPYYCHNLEKQVTIEYELKEASVVNIVCSNHSKCRVLSICPFTEMVVKK